MGARLRRRRNGRSRRLSVSCVGLCRQGHSCNGREGIRGRSGDGPPERSPGDQPSPARSGSRLPRQSRRGETRGRTPPIERGLRESGLLRGLRQGRRGEQRGDRLLSESALVPVARRARIPVSGRFCGHLCSTLRNSLIRSVKVKGGIREPSSAGAMTWIARSVPPFAPVNSWRDRGRCERQRGDRPRSG
jgi:hypothetical protein